MVISRRGFVMGAMAGLAAAAAPVAGCSGRQSATTPRDVAWRDLASHLRGRVLRPGDAEFDALGMPLNQRFNSIRPAGVAVCATAEDVSYAVTWARENGMPLAARSGGHSYMGYSTNDGLVISLREMNSVRYQSNSNQVSAGGGALNKDVARVLTPTDVMMAGGQCPTVGVAGLTLGGGLGFSMRSLGVTSDNLAASQVVLASGDIVTASASENPDLFWALRGGAGGNFGINTEFTYAAHPARDCTHFAVEFPADRTADMLDAWFTVLADAPRELGFIWYSAPGATPGEQGICGTWGQMYGSAADTRDVLAPVMGVAGPPRTDVIKEGTYWDAVSFLAEDDSTPHAGIDRSRFIEERFGGDAVAALTARLAEQPAGSANTAIFAWGGAIADTAPPATAFVHRQATALIKYGATWRPGDDATARTSTQWVNDTFEAMQPYCASRSFQNFPDGELTDWADAYYGDNLNRLVDVKRKYDPDRFFTFPQSIGREP